MPTVDIDGIATHSEISGSGPPILMMALKLPTLILPGHTDFHATSCAVISAPPGLALLEREG